MFAPLKPSVATADRRGMLRLLGAALAVGAGLSPAAGAQEEPIRPWRRRRALRRALRRARRRERAAAREALNRGEVRPLSELLESFNQEIGGEVVDVTYREGPRGWRGYIVKSVQPGGRLARHVINARTGEIITMREALRRLDAAQ